MICGKQPLEADSLQEKQDRREREGKKIEEKSNSRIMTTEKKKKKTPNLP